MLASSHRFIGQPVLPESVASIQFLPRKIGGGFLELPNLFLILAVVPGLLGAKGIAGLSWIIAKWLVITFVVLTIISFIL